METGSQTDIFGFRCRQTARFKNDKPGSVSLKRESGLFLLSDDAACIKIRQNLQQEEAEAHDEIGSQKDRPFKPIGVPIRCQACDQNSA